MPWCDCVSVCNLITRAPFQISAASASGLRVLLEIGAAVPAHLRNASGQLLAVSFLEHTGVLGHEAVAVAVLHCSLGPAQDSVALLTPVVCLPRLPVQSEVASRLRGLGVASIVESSPVTVEDVRTQLQLLLSSDRYGLLASRSVFRPCSSGGFCAAWESIWREPKCFSRVQAVG